MTEYEGFSEQDLIDRRESLRLELFDNFLASEKLHEEIKNIDKLLKEK